jgi:hypothetical protein
LVKGKGRIVDCGAAFFIFKWKRHYDHGPQNRLCSARASYLEWVAERRARELSVCTPTTV